MKKVTYQGRIYTVEDSVPLFLKLTGIGWRKEIDCSHWIYGWFYSVFNVTWKGEIK